MRWGIIAIVVLLALLVVGLLLWSFNQAPNEMAQGSPLVSLLPTPSPLSSALLSPSPSTSPTLSVKGKQVTDASNLFTITLPSDWKITLSEGKKGVQLSRLTAQSPDFVLRQDTSSEGPFIPQYYESGASFSAHVVRGRSEVVNEGRGATGTVREEEVTIDGITGLKRLVKEISVETGQTFDAIVHRDGYNYIFSLSYNPDTYPQGEAVFDGILDSVTFAP